MLTYYSQLLLHLTLLKQDTSTYQSTLVFQKKNGFVLSLFLYNFKSQVYQIVSVFSVFNTSPK